MTMDKDVPRAEGESTANLPSGTDGSGDKPASILINFVLDKSGSMGSIADATISGFNEFKNDQAEEDGDAYFTLTLFDTGFHTVSEAAPIREVPDLDRASYRTSGMTALYDAIGHTMRVTDDFVAAHRPDQVLFVIMTDGYENSSREYTQQRIFDLIRDRQKLNGYEFIYLGANQDSYATGMEIGVREGRMLDYDADAASAGATFKRASANVTAHRRAGKPQRDQFFSENLESIASVSPSAWKAMSPAEKKARLREHGE